MRIIFNGVSAITNSVRLTISISVSDVMRWRLAGEPGGGPGGSKWFTEGLYPRYGYTAPPMGKEEVGITGKNYEILGVKKWFEKSFQVAY